MIDTHASSRAALFAYLIRLLAAVQAKSLADTVFQACRSHQALIDESWGRIDSSAKEVAAALEWVETQMRSGDIARPWRLFQVGSGPSEVQKLDIMLPESAQR